MYLERELYLDRRARGTHILHDSIVVGDKSLIPFPDSLTFNPDFGREVSHEPCVGYAVSDWCHCNSRFGCTQLHIHFKLVFILVY